MQSQKNILTWRQWGYQKWHFGTKTNETRLVYNCVHLTIKKELFWYKKEKEPGGKGGKDFAWKEYFCSGSKKESRKKEKNYIGDKISVRGRAEERMMKIVQERKTYILARRERKRAEKKKTARNLDDLFDHLLLLLVNHVFYFGLKI